LCWRHFRVWPPASTVAIGRPERLERPTGQVNVAIAVADEACCRIHEVIDACRALGLEHTGTLRAVGVLTGSVQIGRVGELRVVPGVLIVEVERDSRL
jgi:hypothetical protein